MSLAPATRLGPYEIVAPLGAGGMGEVYRAKDARLGREVAVKVLPADVAGDAERLRRFEQEARAASALNHPGILTVHDFGSHDGVAYLVTELLEGETLRDALRRGALPARRAVELAIQVARGLAAAHDKGIVHRDLKPENLFLTRDGPAKILDFGLARVERPELSAADLQEGPTFLETQAGVVLGTVGYMAPEQVRGERADARSDLFSLGVVLHEMLAGTNPFRRDSAIESLNAILTEEPPAVASTAAGAVSPLGRVVGRLLEKRPEGRFQSARDLAFALEELASTPPSVAVSAAPGGALAPTRRLRRFVWLGVAAAALATGALFLRTTRDVGPASAAPVPEVKSLAVLPLEEIGATGERYFGVGVADTIQTKLAAIDTLIVRPTSAVRRFAGADIDPLAAGRELDVDAVLAGSVQRADGRLRMNLRLLTVDGRNLWAETFDDAEGQIFAIQDRIAQQVLTQLRIRLDRATRLATAPTRNPAAYDAFLRGLADMDRRQSSAEAALAAIGHFEAALRLDPISAPAWAKLAEAEAWMGTFHEPDRAEWIQRAHRSLERARALDPGLAEPFIVEMLIRWSDAGAWDIPGAIQALLRAQQLDPRAGLAELGMLYDHLGFDERAVSTLRRALEVDPSSTATREWLVSALVDSGAWQSGLDEGARLEGTFAWTSIQALLWLNRVDEADRVVESLLADSSDGPYTRARWALVAARRGRTKEALAEVAKLAPQVERRRRSYHHLAHDFAAIHALAGDAPGAVRWLDQMVVTGMPNLPLIVRDPHFGPIRQTAEYRAFEARLRPIWEGNLREVE